MYALTMKAGLDIRQWAQGDECEVLYLFWTLTLVNTRLSSGFISFP